jgi:hypothetical protein
MQMTLSAAKYMTTHDGDSPMTQSEAMQVTLSAAKYMTTHDGDSQMT